MTNSELNLAIAKLINKGKNVKIELREGAVISTSALSSRPTYLDYVGDWRQLMPLVFEYRIFVSMAAVSKAGMRDNLKRFLAERLFKALQDGDTE